MNTAPRTPPRGFRFPGAVDGFAGLAAFAVPDRDGNYRKGRRGIDIVTRVTLEPEEDTTPHRPAGLTNTQWSWLTSAPRRWDSITKRLGLEAQQLITELARSNCLRIECDFTAGRIQTPPRQTIPNEALCAEHRTQTTQERNRRQELATRAAELAEHLEASWPGVATALRDLPSHDQRLTWVVAAARDLAVGRTHDGPRAFVQAHEPTRGTKAREDIQALLRSLGCEPDAITALGITRAPYIGIGGPLSLTVNDHPISTGPLPGPHSFRLSHRMNLHLLPRPAVRRLIVIENRQAAEAACDTWPDEAIIWCQGQVADLAVHLIAQAAQGLSQVVICPDADLGGVHIAARILDHLANREAVRVIDVGAGDHPVGKAFSGAATQALQHLAARDDPAGKLATECLRRGHAVEQEAPIRGALRTFMDTSGRGK
ncbi:MAG: DUF2399 domain-containing protein [Micromonosporaceae bacterium]